MFVYAAAALCLLLLAVSGVLTYKNSKLIAHKRTLNAPVLPKARYTVVNMKSLIEDHHAEGVPLLQITYDEQGETCHLYLCRVSGGSGDLRLGEADQIYEQRLQELLNKGCSITAVLSFDELNLDEEEQQIIHRLKKLPAH